MITYNYDELGRVKTRAIDGVALTYEYDELGRITGETNALGTFNYDYEVVTSRLKTVTYPNGQTTSYCYYGNSEDRRLLERAIVGLVTRSVPAGTRQTLTSSQLSGMGL